MKVKRTWFDINEEEEYLPKCERGENHAASVIVSVRSGGSCRVHYLCDSHDDLPGEA